MKHLKSYNESETHKTREDRCLEEIRDIFADISDEDIGVNVRVNRRDTRGKTLYEILFAYRVSYGVSSTTSEVKEHHNRLNRIQMDTFDCIIRLEKMGYALLSDKVSITSEKLTSHSPLGGLCDLSVNIQLWK